MTKSGPRTLKGGYSACLKILCSTEFKMNKISGKRSDESIGIEIHSVRDGCYRGNEGIFD